MFLRASYHKTGRMRFLAHLDLARTMHRAIARADIPVAHSEGFNPQPRLAFGPPVSLGVEGLEEWVDIVLTREMSPGEFMQRINNALSEGLGFDNAFELTKRAASLGSVLKWARYKVEPVTGQPLPAETIRAALASDKLEITRHSKTGDKIVEVRDRIRELTLDGPVLHALLACGSDGSLGILDLMRHFTGLEAPGVLAGYRVTRQKLYAEENGAIAEIAPIVPPHA
jgi:radical SAM-linked protein